MDAASASSSLDGRSHVSGAALQVQGGTTSGADFNKLGMFGGGDLSSLGGSGAFGTSLINGNYTANDTNSATFDLSDFPSLGGGAGGGTPNSAGATTGAPTNGLATALRQQQLLAQQRQMLQQGTANKTSDLYRISASGGGGGGASDGGWPALGAPGAGGNNGSPSATSPFLLRPTGSETPGEKTPSVSRTSSNSSATSGFYNPTNNPANNNTANAADGALDSGGIRHVDSNSILGGLGFQSAGGTTLAPHEQQRSSTPSTPTASAAAAGNAMRGDFGLLGLLTLIRMPDSDRKALALGTDLTLFGTPWSDNSKEPQYQLPMCYYMQPPQLKTGHLSKFQLETLFYIFYALPKDVLQAYAAQELYAREWRYHVDLKLWFKEVGPNDAPAGQAGSSVASGTPQYMYFDINSWEGRLCNGTMMVDKNVMSGFLPEDDVRVTFAKTQ